MQTRRLFQRLSWALAMLAGAFVGSSAQAQDGPVRLLYAEVEARCPDNAPFCVQMEARVHGFVEVENLGFEKQVTARIRARGDDWQDVEAGYVAPTFGNYEAWEFTTEWRPFAARLSAEYQFAVRYGVAGQEYWDNNDGGDYFVAVGPRQVIGGPQLLLGASALAVQQAFLFPGPEDTRAFSGRVIVENIAFEKAVTVVFSTDGWQTVQEVSAQYQRPWYGNTEAWTFVATGLDGATSQVDFAVRYDVAGETHWDNDFGSDHQVVLPN